ncbi:MAG TPA: FAD-dependent oxidoreductase [Lysobacter sp.]
MSTGKTLPLWDSLSAFNDANFVAALPPADADVVVVGAGVAGLSIALCCAQEGRGVLVIDRQGAGEGESLRTTAHLASALDDRFHKLAQWHGHDGARGAAESHAGAIDWIEDLCSATPDGCGFKRVPAYLFAHDGDVKPLRREFDAAAEAGLDVAWIDNGIPGLPRLGPALRYGHQARVDMGRYLRALAEACRQHGVRFARGNATQAQGGARPTLVVDDRTLHANVLAIASNVPFHERVAVHTKQAAYRTYVIAGPYEGTAVPDALLWDDGDPYHYVRLAESGDGTRMLVVGGEDHKTGQDHDAARYVHLQEWARRHLPGASQFTHAWSGQVLEPADGLAFIGADPGGEENVYVVTGDSGNGVTHGTLGGLIIADLVVGRPNRWAALYDPQRMQLRAPGGWLAENANVALQYRDWLEGGDIGDADALSPGQGAVVRHGIHRVAVYRSGDGAMHAHSARCPHLGCAVRWNAQEKSWDCPCHGSRFEAATGAVLNGPASAPLSPWPRMPSR